MADRRAFVRVLRELERGEPAPWDPSESLTRAVDAAAAVLGAAVVTPLRGKAGVLGAIVFGSHRPGRYREADLEIIEQLATRTGIAIERTRRTLDIASGATVDGGQQQRA